MPLMLNVAIFMGARSCWFVRCYPFRAPSCKRSAYLIVSALRHFSPMRMRREPLKQRLNQPLGAVCLRFQFSEERNWRSQIGHNA
jgi:hypothetical protein